MTPPTWLYRHDELSIPRPYSFDVDEHDWLWEGSGERLLGHHLRTAELRIQHVPDAGCIYAVFVWQGRAIMPLGNHRPYYVVRELETGRDRRMPVPGALPVIWYGTKTHNDKLLLYERLDSKVLVLDAPEAAPCIVPCPFAGSVAGGLQAADGLVYSVVTDPARLIRFDPVQGRFTDEIPLRFPEARLAGGVELGGVLYYPDALAGRLLGYDLARGRWLDPIPTPDYLKVYGFIGAGFGFDGKAYYCLSTCRARGRINPTTGTCETVPDGPESIDGRPMRFLDRMLVFDPAGGVFDYLVAPAQPDGIPLLCYAWTQGARFAVTGIVIPFDEPGVPAADQMGAWIVLQDTPADAEPGFGPYDLTFDRDAHIRSYRRSYSWKRSLFLPEATYSPPPVNQRGVATHYPPELNDVLARRAARTNPETYWKDLAERLLPADATAAEKVKRIGRFVNQALYYNPTQVPQFQDPIAFLESHDARCGQGVNVSLALLRAAGIEGRAVALNHHVVGEAFHDGGWHLLDALFFGGDQPHRDGRVLSVDELKAAPYYADTWPQYCFWYDPELLTSEDGFQVLGYVFGPWGSEPYYSYYLGAPKDCPPTLPTILPAQRLDAATLRLRWSESIKLGGGAVEYECRVCTDRACQTSIFTVTTRETSVRFPVSESNYLYYMEVRALDDHRAHNPTTWYPPARWNFVFVPEDQYGWYGVM